MKNKNTLLTKIVAITFLFMLMLNNVPMSNAATSDTINVSVTVNSVISISETAGGNLSVTVDPSTADTSHTNTLTVSSNDVTGFNVAVSIVGIQTSPVSAVLSDDASGTNTMATDGTDSYISVTSNAGAGSISGATYTTSEAKLIAAGVEVITTSSTTNSDVFDVDYDVFADSTVVPTVYQGVITYTIASGA